MKATLAINRWKESGFKSQSFKSCKTFSKNIAYDQLVDQVSWPNDLQFRDIFENVLSLSCANTYYDVTTLEADGNLNISRAEHEFSMKWRFLNCATNTAFSDVTIF